MAIAPVLLDRLKSAMPALQTYYDQARKDVEEARKQGGLPAAAGAALRKGVVGAGVGVNETLAPLVEGASGFAKGLFGVNTASSPTAAAPQPVPSSQIPEKAALPAWVNPETALPAPTAARGIFNETGPDSGTIRATKQPDGVPLFEGRGNVSGGYSGDTSLIKSGALSVVPSTLAADQKALANLTTSATAGAPQDNRLSGPDAEAWGQRQRQISLLNDILSQPSWTVGKRSKADTALVSQLLKGQQDTEQARVTGGFGVEQARISGLSAQEQARISGLSAQEQARIAGSFGVKQAEAGHERTPIQVLQNEILTLTQNMETPGLTPEAKAALKQQRDERVQLAQSMGAGIGAAGISATAKVNAGHIKILSDQAAIGQNPSGLARYYEALKAGSDADSAMALALAPP